MVIVYKKNGREKKMGKRKKRSDRFYFYTTLNVFFSFSRSNFIIYIYIYINFDYSVLFSTKSGRLFHWFELKAFMIPNFAM